MSGAQEARDQHTAVRQPESLNGMEERRYPERKTTTELEKTVGDPHSMQLQKAMDKIRTEEFNCGLRCCRRCKPYKRTTRAPSVISTPVKEILTHKMEKDVVWLYCRPGSKRANPEYRRQCEVPAELRVAYLNKLQQLQRVPTEEEVGNVDDDESTFPAVPPPKPSRRNQKQAHSSDTHNGETTNEQDHNTQGPAAMEGDAELWEIERILGGVMNQSRRYYLVKWVGWTPEYNSWEEETAFAGSKHLLRHFIKEFGKPTWKNPRVMSPEGEEHEAWLAQLKTEPPKQKRAATPWPAATRRTQRTAAVIRSQRVTESAEAEALLHAVERVIGAQLDSAHGVSVLVKWRDGDLAECTWEKADSVQEALQNFYMDHGKPTLVNPKVLSPEGQEYEAHLRAAERQQPGKKRPHTDDDTKGVIKRRGRPA